MMTELNGLQVTRRATEMIETILEQVEIAVDRFVAKNPSLRNDRDDLVQDIFLKILPRINMKDFSLSQCRAFAHKATFFVCQTALRAISSSKLPRNFPLLSDLFVYKGDGDGLPAPNFIDWDRVEYVIEENKGLFKWYTIEPETHTY